MIATKEIRERAIYAHLKRGLTQDQVAQNYNVHITTFQRWLSAFRKTGSYSPKKRGHRKAVFSDKRLKQLDSLVSKTPDATLEELQAMCGFSVSIVTIHNALKKLGYCYKKNSSCGGTRTQ